MKNLISRSLLLATAFLLVTSAFAAEKTSITTYAPMTVSGKQLQAGHYTIQWEGNGPMVQVSILRDKSVVAVTPARLVDVKLGSDNSGYSLTTNSDGSQTLSEIHLHDKKHALEFSGEAAAPETASTK
ncbi:MAG TPA: hypothetical protein VH079_08025 [Terriglobales bacterium]|jgi:hypothetical protein|nr:hypothetical protein [Terriglobales bacterium]